MIADPCIAICADRCAQESGDQPCWQIRRDHGQKWEPCDECLREAGIVPVEKIDPAAAIGNLL